MSRESISITIVESGIDIKNILQNFLKGKNIDEVTQASDCNLYPDSDVLICSLELTHAENAQVATEKAKKYLEKYSTVIFCEPSSYSRDRLRGLGFKSIHENFSENKMFGEINFQFFENLGLQCHVTSISEYGYEAAYHVRSTYLVPVESTGGVDYNGIHSRPDVPIRFPVFNVQFFVLSKFDAPTINLAVDVELLQFKLLQPNASAGDILLTNFKSPYEIGEICYETSEENISYFKEMIKEPVYVNDDNSTNDLFRIKVDEWLKLTSFTLEKQSIVKFNKCIITGCGFLYSNNHPVARSDYLLPYLTASIYNPIWGSLQKLHPMRNINGPVIVAFNHLYTNYYHFLAECLNAAYLCYMYLSSRGVEKINIVTFKMKGFSKDYFDMLFSKNQNISIIEISESEYIHANEVYYAPELLGFTTPQPCLIAERSDFKNAILSHSGVEMQKNPTDIIYISRRDTAARKICNENELIFALEKLGVKIVQLTGLSVKEQISMFANAALVIGAHGAGISNSLFMQKTSTMLELIQASYQNVGPMRLAQSSGAQYVSMLFFQDGEGDSWYVDIDRVCRYIKNMKTLNIIEL
ncbi:glycosyltransferase family 61 protein [Acetobacter persici]|uniref:glycosyltransferase family 61 protein n=1 Tax=Acetobacter persici TaxID=1076596 RepID=UPI001F2DD35D|nr:glycosyltransferase family 61 protein [Acetobacter persici]MCG0998823.1 glycosyltransferase family 61 protein [Acetobacter persici]